MKFELKPYNRNATDEVILGDIIRVAEELKQSTLSLNDYKQHGRFNYSTVTRRFGPWVRVMELAGLQVINYHKLDEAQLLEDLKSVAKTINKNTVSQPEYRAHGKYSPDPYNRFGSWNSALEKAGLKKSRNVEITTEQLFENLEEIWTKLGRQPNYGEVAKPLSKYSKDCYVRRFGSWRKALESFVKFVNDDEAKSVVEEKPLTITTPNSESIIEASQQKTKRGVNWRLRFLVMRRDNFKCKGCGRTPATDPSIILPVDHIKAWANGGETTFENLQTLCSKCNIGKSDLE